MSDFNQMIGRAKKIRDLYAKHNEQAGIKKWTASDYADGMVGDMGDFIKLLMAKNGVREIDNTENKIEHEVADIFWSLLVICDELGVDLQKSFDATMDELESRLRPKT